jgi:hypothetical protein
MWRSRAAHVRDVDPVLDIADAVDLGDAMGCGAIPLEPRFQRPSTTGNRSQTEGEERGGHVRPNRQIAHRSAIVVCSGCGGRRPHGLSLPSRVAGGENTA